ncbi:MAG: DNA-protecting protein DprA [Tissierellia bacterium]|nr:DNA-protecting protein DprA [Tissierellia bacterium]
MENRDILIWLNSLYLSDKFFDELIDGKDDLNYIFRCSAEDLSEVKFANKKNIEKLKRGMDKGYLNSVIDGINRYCDDVITIYDENYPEELLIIDNSPKVIYTKGKKLDMQSPTIGIVGARKCTDYGNWACKKLVGELTDLGITIISGLAAGIDGIAHKTALSKNGYSIGVLGNGLDIVYPRSNQRLYEEMFVDGTVITEYPIGTAAANWNFPRRNRIISGLSLGIVVIEAKEKSGSLITASYAAEQGKEIFSLPGNINSIYSVGTNRLIRDGAIPLLDIEDILINVSKLKDYVIKSEESDIVELEGIEKDVYELYNRGYNSVDKIISETNFELSEISAALTMLELKGII